MYNAQGETLVPAGMNIQAAQNSTFAGEHFQMGVAQDDMYGRFEAFHSPSQQPFAAPEVEFATQAQFGFGAFRNDDQLNQSSAITDPYLQAGASSASHQSETIFRQSPSQPQLSTLPSPSRQLPSDHHLHTAFSQPSSPLSLLSSSSRQPSEHHVHTAFSQPSSQTSSLLSLSRQPSGTVNSSRRRGASLGRTQPRRSRQSSSRLRPLRPSSSLSQGVDDGQIFGTTAMSSTMVSGLDSDPLYAKVFARSEPVLLTLPDLDYNGAEDEARSPQPEYDRRIVPTAIQFYIKQLITSDDMFLINSRRKQERPTPNQVRVEKALKVAHSSLGLQMPAEFPANMRERVIKQGNKVRSDQRNWFIKHSEELFPYIFVTRNENDSNEAYFNRVLSRSHHFLNPITPLFIYPINEQGIPLDQRPFEARWILEAFVHLFWGNSSAPGAMNSHLFNEGMHSQTLAMLITSAHAAIQATIGLLQTGRVPDMNDNDLDQTFLRYLYIVEKVRGDIGMRAKVEREMADMITHGRAFYARWMLQPKSSSRTSQLIGPLPRLPGIDDTSLVLGPQSSASNTQPPVPAVSLPYVGQTFT